MAHASIPPHMCIRDKRMLTECLISKLSSSVLFAVQVRMMGMQVHAAGHRGGSLSATVRAASLALHDERPAGQGAWQKPSSPAAGLQPALRAADATPANAIVLVNDAWQWERTQPRIGSGADEAECSRVQTGSLPAWHRVRGAVLAQEGPFAQPAARLARHSSFKWDVAAPLGEPLVEPHRLNASADWQAASTRRADAAARAGGAPSGPAETLDPASGTAACEPMSILREATPAASRAGSVVGDTGAAGDDDVEEVEDGFLLEYVIHGVALGPVRGPQVRMSLSPACLIQQHYQCILVCIHCMLVQY